MTTFTNAEGGHKGIAYGLDKILDATWTNCTGAMGAMEWAMTYPNDAAAVITYAYGGWIGGDKRMDKDDPDYDEDYGVRSDNLIHAHEVLIIQSAGNESRNKDDEYSLSWGADSYNAIVVGASTGSTAGERRLDNTVRSSSSRGPTPRGRKKPDVVAPGTHITTTIRNGGFASVSGTSVAAPHVAGAILLFWDHGLWHPMLVKALLINSAEDRGPTGWDKDWGWGYIDLYTALEQYDYTKIGSINGGAERWYKGTMSGCQTATLVWHIHEREALANLEMYLYDVTGKEVLDSSASLIDNVEQVKMPKGHDGTVYIKIVYNIYDLPYGYYSEIFGLALPSNFTPEGPPSP